MSLKNFWNNVIDCIKKWNNSESSIKKKKWMIKKFWNYIKVSWLFWLILALIQLFLLWAFIVFIKQNRNFLDFSKDIISFINILHDNILTTVLALIFTFFIGLVFLLFWEYSKEEKKNDLNTIRLNNDISDKSVWFNILKEYFIIFKKYIINHVWYTILFLSFLSLTIFIIILRIKWLEIQIDKHFFSLWVMIFLWLLLTVSDTDFTKRSINTTILVIWFSVIPLFISIFYLFSYFYDSSWIKIKNNDLIKILTGINFLYVNGKKLAYIDFTSWSLLKPLKFKSSKDLEINSLDNINIILHNINNLHNKQIGKNEKLNKKFISIEINNKIIWSSKITYTWKNNTLTWVIHILPQPNNKIILSNNKLAWEIAWIKLNNLSWSYKDLEKIYSDTLNSSYVSTYTTSHMIFNSFLTILLFTITIIFLKQAIKTNNQKKEILNKLQKLWLYIELTNQEDSKNTIEIKDKILKEIEKDIQIFIPQFPIDNDTKYLDQLTEKTLNMINKKKST